MLNNDPNSGVKAARAGRSVRLSHSLEEYSLEKYMEHQGEEFE